jgi:hypothetical protein
MARLAVKLRPWPFDVSSTPFGTKSVDEVTKVSLFKFIEMTHLSLCLVITSVRSNVLSRDMVWNEMLIVREDILLYLKAQVWESSKVYKQKWSLDEE